MTPEQKLEMAKQVANDIGYGDTPPAENKENWAVRSALLAIDRMQERVRAETERCARIAEGWRENDWPEGFCRWTAEHLASDIAAAIRETPHEK